VVRELTQELRLAGSQSPCVQDGLQLGGFQNGHVVDEVDQIGRGDCHIHGDESVLGVMALISMAQENI